MSYRDDYAAALERANHAEREFAELYQKNSTDQKRLKELEIQLKRAQKTLQKHGAKSAFSSRPFEGNGESKLLPVAIFLVLGFFLWSWLKSPYEDTHHIFSIPQIPTLPTIEPPPDFSSVIGSLPPTKLPLLPCAPLQAKLESAKTLPVIEFTPPSGCQALAANQIFSEKELRTFSEKFVVIDNEKAFRKFYTCKDFDGNKIQPTSGTDFQAFRLAIHYEKKASFSQAKFIAETPKSVVVGFSPQQNLTESADAFQHSFPTGPTQVLLPIAKKPIVSFFCPLQTLPVSSSFE